MTKIEETKNMVDYEGIIIYALGSTWLIATLTIANALIFDNPIDIIVVIATLPAVITTLLTVLYYFLLKDVRK